MRWAVSTLHGVAQIVEYSKDSRTAARVIEDGLSPHHARRIVIAHNLVVDSLTKCPDCNGHGDVMTRGLPGDEWPETCRTCNGTGKTKKRRRTPTMDEFWPIVDR